MSTSSSSDVSTSSSSDEEKTAGMRECAFCTTEYPVADAECNVCQTSSVYKTFAEVDAAAQKVAKKREASGNVVSI